MTDMNNFNQFFTMDEFATLSRDGMYKALVFADPARAKGKSRAKKDELTKLYVQSGASLKVVRKAPLPPSLLAQAADAAGVDVSKHDASSPNFQRLVPDFSDEAVAQQKNQNISMSGHVHGPDCNHEPMVIVGSETALEARLAAPKAETGVVLPTIPGLEGLEEFVRANPPMPELVDGQMHMLPAEQPQGEPVFAFRGEPRALTPKEERLIKDLLKHFEIFRNNVAHTDAKKTVLDTIYALKVCGIVANPKFVESIKQGRAWLKDARAKWKAGVNVSEPKTDEAQPTS